MTYNVDYCPVSTYAFLKWPEPTTPVLTAADISEWQRGRCAFCGDSTRLVSDHDHATSLFRGKLCFACNLEESGGDKGWRAWRTGMTPAGRFNVVAIYISPVSRLPVFRVSDSADAEAIFRLAGFDFTSIPYPTPADPQPGDHARVVALRDRVHADRIASWTP